MKSDLDALMTERSLDALLVEGPDGMGSANPAFAYLTQGASVVGSVIKRRGASPQLLYRSMERDEAESSGLELVNLDRWPVHEIQDQAATLLEARVELYRRILTDLGATGRIGVYGTGPIGAYHKLLTELSEALPSVEFVGEYTDDVISRARETKDAEEIAAMRHVGESANEVVEEVIQFLTSHDVRNGTLVKRDGSALTIGDVKALIRMEQAERGLESPSGFICAIGRDAGVPHSRGNPDDPIELGKPMLIDFFPRDESGYFHDMTRTFCLGHAPEGVQTAYRDVMEAFNAVVAELTLGESTQAYQHFVCDVLEQRGHPSPKSDPKTTEGYVHSLAHGLGLEVHEAPYFRTFGPSDTVLEPGMVFTVEPGLYYPDRGYGIRIEDTYYADKDGSFQSLTPFPKDLVVDMGA
ncbi:MAG: M24 family metallopeptidase [Candidatus Bipolaricaulia bacterium]